MTLRPAGCLLLLAACAPGSAEPGSGAGGERAPVPRAASTGEFGTTHHALLGGVVVGGAGEPVPAATVIARDLVQPERGAMPRSEGTSDARGRFSFPVRAWLPAAGDTVGAGVLVMAVRGQGSTAQVDSAVAHVVFVRLNRRPPIAEVRLRFPAAPPDPPRLRASRPGKQDDAAVTEASSAGAGG